MLKLFEKYKGIILYIIFGGLTTCINIIVYYICSYVLSMSTVASNIVAWILSVLFAYVTNRLWVFESQVQDLQGLVREIVSFFSCRLATGVLDIVLMYIFVDLLLFPGIIMKCISNVLVIVLNYVASQMIIFKH